MNLCPPPHLFFPFGTEPIIFDTLLFVREACQIRRLVMGRPRLAERGLRVESHVWLVYVSECVDLNVHSGDWGTHRMFFRCLILTSILICILIVDLECEINPDLECDDQCWCQY